MCVCFSLYGGSIKLTTIYKHTRTPWRSIFFHGKIWKRWCCPCGGICVNKTRAPCFDKALLARFYSDGKFLWKLPIFKCSHLKISQMVLTCTKALAQQTRAVFWLNVNFLNMLWFGWRILFWLKIDSSMMNTHQKA